MSTLSKATATRVSSRKVLIFYYRKHRKTSYPFFPSTSKKLVGFCSTWFATARQKTDKHNQLQWRLRTANRFYCVQPKQNTVSPTLKARTWILSTLKLLLTHSMSVDFWNELRKIMELSPKFVLNCHVTKSEKIQKKILNL